MALIDARGRVFGRVNVIDLLIAIVVLGAIPLIYGAFVLFRVPLPTITSIAPQRITEYQATTVTISGSDFRPFMGAYIGDTPSKGFLLQTPMQAEIKVPPMPPGRYDLALFDDAEELLRKKAMLIVGPPLPRGVIARVRFVAPPEVVAQFKAGDVDVEGESARGAVAPNDDDRAVLSSIDTERQQVSAVQVIGNGVNRSVHVPQSMVALVGTVRVPVVSTPTGFSYKDRPVKIGAAFWFESRTGQMVGSILDVQPVPQSEAATR